MSIIPHSIKHINIWKWIAVYLLLLLFYFLIENDKLIEEADIIRRYQSDLPKAVLYIANYLACILSAVILIFQRSRSIFAFVLALITVSLFINKGYAVLNGVGIGYEDVLLLKQNAGFGLESEAFATYLPKIHVPFLYSLLLIGLTLGLRRYFLKDRLSYLFLIIPLLTYVSSYSIMNYSLGNRMMYPSFIKIPALLHYTINHQLYSSDRLPVPILPSHVSSFDHILWIVDESVRGDYLQINDPIIETTPFVDSISNDYILNFGVASSGAVCSDYSHIMLMSGIRPDQLPDVNQLSRKNPTIFQYAIKAGYSTNLIYSPGYEDEPKGYMTQNDFDYVQNRYQTEMVNPNLAPYQWDHKSIEYVSEVINSQGKSFTYFLKYGAHFHYEHSYPSDRQFFSPIQDPNTYTRENREALINSYKNALRWTVDDFWEALHEVVSDKNILIIYTSDHGQNLMDHPEILMTHCVKKEAPQEMAAVPLFMYSPMIEGLRSTYCPSNVNQASHFNIFPTTLSLMGYDSVFISKNLVPTLFDSLSQENTYLSGDIFGRSKLYKNLFDKSRYKTPH